jgi:phosphoribosylanthranilate isomerase
VIRIKICGITRPEDAQLAVDLGASAIGMVFWPGSPRCIDIARARAIVKSLPAFVTAVGVFVNQEDAGRIAERAGLHALQLHGDEPASSYRTAALPVIKAVPVRDWSALEVAEEVPRSATVLLDAHDPVKRGGTGQRIDWGLAAEIAERRPVILSGGLSAANVRAAIAEVKPYAVDVSSGVESAPGVKDPAKMLELFDMLHPS